MNRNLPCIPLRILPTETFCGCPPASLSTEAHFRLGLLYEGLGFTRLMLMYSYTPPWSERGSHSRVLTRCGLALAAAGMSSPTNKIITAFGGKEKEKRNIVSLRFAHSVSPWAQSSCSLPSPPFEYAVPSCLRNIKIPEHAAECRGRRHTWRQLAGKSCHWTE